MGQQCLGDSWSRAGCCRAGVRGVGTTLGGPGIPAAGVPFSPETRVVSESPVPRCCGPRACGVARGAGAAGRVPSRPRPLVEPLGGWRSGWRGGSSRPRSRAVARAAWCSPGGDGSACVLLQTRSRCPRAGATTRLTALGKQLIFF